MQRIYCHNCSRQFVVQDITTCPACHEGFVEVVGQEAAQPAGPQRQAGYQRSFQLPGGMGTVHVMMGSGGPPDFGGGYMGPAPDPFELIRALMGGTPFAGQDLLIGGLGGVDYDQEQMDRIVTQVMNQYQPQTRQTAERVRNNLPRLKVRPRPVAGTQQGQASGSCGHDDEDMGMATVHEGEQCSVCHDEFCCGGEVVELPCNHCFHEDCLMPWLEEHNTCPVCRLELPTEDGQQRGGSSRRGAGLGRASSSQRQQQQQQQGGSAEGGEGWMGSLNQLLHNIADRWEASHTGTGGQGGAHASTASAAAGTAAGPSTRPSPGASRQFSSSRGSEPAPPRAHSYPSMPQPSAPPMPESPRTAAGRAAAARAAARAPSSGGMWGAGGSESQQQQQQQGPAGMASESRGSTFRAASGRASSSQGAAGSHNTSQQQQQGQQQGQQQEQDNGVSLGLAIGGAVAALVGSAVSAMWNRNRRRE